MFVMTQEGHPIMLDRRMNYKVIKKMPGAKGSVRDATTVLVPGVDGKDSKELIITCGCDRFVRIFDPAQNLE